MGRRTDRRLRNFLIDRDYQMRFALQMVVVSGGLTSGLGWLVYRFNREAARVVSLRALDPSDEAAQQLASQFAHGEQMLLAALIVFGVLLAALLAVWQIITTHKVAGPLYYIAHQIRRIRDGYLGTLHPLRKGDLLHGFFEDFRSMHEALRVRARREATTFARLAESAEKAGLPDVAEELRVLQQQRQGSLEEPKGEPSEPGRRSAAG